MASSPSSGTDSRSRGNSNSNDKPALNQVSTVISENLLEYAKSTRANEIDKDLTICDIIGEWGLYQWSLVAFAAMYSGMFCTIVVVGPVWTPDMAHRCINSTQKHLQLDELKSLKEQYFGSTGNNDSSSSLHQCYIDEPDGTANSSSTGPGSSDGRNCEYFIYDDESSGRMLTNSFDLVCDRHWLRSFIMSSALLGMLISSVTLGQLSDKYGRLRCIQISFIISLISTLGAILSPNYLLLNIFICLMSYAQAGAGNALCTLVMEATTPRLRCVATFEYCFGWGLGMMVTPLLNNLTQDYVCYLMSLFAFQLLLLPWLHFGVFESIRWLLSEGRINEAQIEIRRACLINRVRNNPHLAQKIARLQLQQVRKASILVANKLDEIIDTYNSQDSGKRPLGGNDLKCNSSQSSSSGEESLNEMGEAIKKSFDYMIENEAHADIDENKNDTKTGDFIKVKDADSMSLKTVIEEPMDIETTNNVKIKVDQQQQQVAENLNQRRISLSPTLANRLFSVSGESDPIRRTAKRQPIQPPVQMMINGKPLEMDEDDDDYDDLSIAPNITKNNNLNNNHLVTLELLKRNSMTSQGLVQLLMQYKNKIQEKEEGAFFLVQMFHKKLYKQTILLLMLELSLETSYYGFVQANKFIGSSVELNYIVGAFSDMTAATLALIISAVFSRKLAVIMPTLIGVTACMTLAGMYQFAPIPVNPINELAPIAPADTNSYSPGEVNPFGAPAISNEQEIIEHLEETSNDDNSQPDSNVTMETIFQLNGYRDQLDSAVIQDTITNTEIAFDRDTTTETTTDSEVDLIVQDTIVVKTNSIDIVEFRNTFDVAVMTLGKLATVTALQVAATISLEIYPSNLRQTGSGAIIFVGRIGSIIAPFLFNDPSEDKLMLKLTLVTLAVIGALVCLATPFFLYDKKNEELCDRIGEIDDE